MAMTPRTRRMVKDISEMTTADDDEIGDSSPPFLPLEEQSSEGYTATSFLTSLSNSARSLSLPATNALLQAPSSVPPSSEKDHFVNNHVKKNQSAFTLCRTNRFQAISGRKLVSVFMSFLLFLVIYDALFRDDDHRWIQPKASADLLEWVQLYPTRGWLVIVLVIAAAVILMVPVGTPLTLGCGYIYKQAYGWRIGLTIATIVSMGGSALGAVTCFLLGRYLMRDTVRKWIRKYPTFDAIDVAVAEHGLRIMAMLYLTPVLPLGPVSYMCGTTSMNLSSFVLAKIASLPLMLLYAFIGASTGALVGGNNLSSKDTNGTENELKSIESNEFLIVSGIVLSLIMIAGITRYIKKELIRILERQQKAKPGELELSVGIHDDKQQDVLDDASVTDLGPVTRRRVQDHQ